MIPCYNYGRLSPTSIAILSCLLISVAVIGGIEPHEVTSQTNLEAFSRMGTATQNQTGTQNQMDTQNHTQTQNQPQMALSNLTRADMGPVTSALNSAWDSLSGTRRSRTHTRLSMTLMTQCSESLKARVLQE